MGFALILLLHSKLLMIYIPRTNTRTQTYYVWMCTTLCLLSLSHCL